MLIIIVKLNVFNAQSERERRKKKKTDTNKSESRQIGDKQVQIDRGTVGEEWDTKKKGETDRGRLRLCMFLEPHSLEV